MIDPKKYVPMLPKSPQIDWKGNVNGDRFKTMIESDAVLLDVIRDDFGKLGTKRGCDLGTCGCCAVLIDGEPRLSCLTLAQEVNGCEITTVEGLADGHHLHPIQQTFAEYGGSQCGFCTPGFLVVISALLEKNQNPNENEIKCAIDGNLCRCTGFQPIVDSVKEAAKILKNSESIKNSTDAKSDPHTGVPSEK